MVKETAAVHFRASGELDEEVAPDESESFGLVKFISLNAKKELLALYSDPDSVGRIIVLRADLSEEVNR